MNRKKLNQLRLKRRTRVRKKLQGRSSLPRLIVNRSNSQIFAQVVDKTGKVLASSTSLKLKKDSLTKTQQSALVGQDLATKLKAGKISAVVLDRGPYKFHGRVKALVEAIKESGIKI